MVDSRLKYQPEDADKAAINLTVKRDFLICPRFEIKFEPTARRTGTIFSHATPHLRCRPTLAVGARQNGQRLKKEICLGAEKGERVLREPCENDNYRRGRGRATNTLYSNRLPSRGRLRAGQINKVLKGH